MLCSWWPRCCKLRMRRRTLCTLPYYDWQTYQWDTPPSIPPMGRASWSHHMPCSCWPNAAQYTRDKTNQTRHSERWSNRSRLPCQQGRARHMCRMVSEAALLHRTIGSHWHQGRHMSCSCSRMSCSCAQRLRRIWSGNSKDSCLAAGTGVDRNAGTVLNHRTGCTQQDSCSSHPHRHRTRHLGMEVHNDHPVCQLLTRSQCILLRMVRCTSSTRRHTADILDWRSGRDQLRMRSHTSFLA